MAARQECHYLQSARNPVWRMGYGPFELQTCPKGENQRIIFNRDWLGRFLAFYILKLTEFPANCLVESPFGEDVTYGLRIE